MSERMRELAEALEQTLDEVAKHHPFKTKSNLGPGPRKETNKKTGNYQFGDKSCKNYVCTGKNKKTGKAKIVRIDPAYKREYNAEYRAWRAKKDAKGKKKAKK